MYMYMYMYMYIMCQYMYTVHVHELRVLCSLMERLSEECSCTSMCLYTHSLLCLGQPYCTAILSKDYTALLFLVQTIDYTALNTDDVSSM